MNQLHLDWFVGEDQQTLVHTLQECVRARSNLIAFNIPLTCVHPIKRKKRKLGLCPSNSNPVSACARAKFTVAKAIGNTKAVAVFEKAMSFGAATHPLALEVKTALYDAKERPMVVDFVVGLGGRDVPPTTFVEGIEKTKEYLKKGEAPLYETLGVRK